MGAGLYIVVNSPEPGFDTFVNGKALARAEGKLTAAAEKLGVIPLMSFFSMSQDDVDAAAEEFGLSEDAVGSAGAERWFEPKDGLRTVRALLALLDTEPNSLGPGVLEDLLGFAKVLETATERGLRWHVAVDY